MKCFVVLILTFISITAHSSEKSCFEVTGMSCSSCKEKIEKMLQKKPGIKSAEVSLKSEVATVIFEKTVASDNLIVQAIEEAGYKGKKIECSN